MRRVLLIDRSDGTAEVLKTALPRRGFEVRAEDQHWRAAQLLRQPLPEWEFVVIVARNTCEDDVTLLRELVVAIAAVSSERRARIYLRVVRTLCSRAAHPNCKIGGTVCTPLILQIGLSKK